MPSKSLFKFQKCNHMFYYISFLIADVNLMMLNHHFVIVQLEMIIGGWIHEIAYELREVNLKVRKFVYWRLIRIASVCLRIHWTISAEWLFTFSKIKIFLEYHKLSRITTENRPRSFIHYTIYTQIMEQPIINIKIEKICLSIHRHHDLPTALAK